MTAACQPPLVQGSSPRRHETGVRRGPGGATRNGAVAAPAFRLRDVVPAAVIVVVLLGVAGCMGALGGGPLDVTPAAISPTAVARPTPAHAPATAGAETSPTTLDAYAEALAAAKRSGPVRVRQVGGKPLLTCGERVLDDASATGGAVDCLVARNDDGTALVVVGPSDPVRSLEGAGHEVAQGAVERVDAP